MSDYQPEGEPRPPRIEAEADLLACVLAEPRRFADARAVVVAEDFADGWHRSAWQALCTLDDRSEAFELAGLRNAMEARAKRPLPGLVARFIAIQGRHVAGAFGPHLASRVSAAGRLERTGETLRAVLAKIPETEATPSAVDELLAEAADQIHKLQGRSPRARMVLLETASREMLATVERVRASGAPPGLSTGLYDLDAILGGLRKEELILLAARPGAGKSSLAWQIAANAARAHQQCLDGRTAQVLYVSLEMGRESLALRSASSAAQIDSLRLARGRFGDEDLDRLREAVHATRGVSLLIDDSPGVKLSELRSRARRCIEGEGLDLIVVDYLQLLQTDAKMRDERLRVAEIGAALKHMARDLQVPVLALSQLSRSLESRTDKRPLLSDLRESGTLEQDADAVIFVYRPALYADAPPNVDPKEWDRKAEIIVAKHRNGPVGTLLAQFYAEHTEFRSRSFAHEEALPR